MIFRGFFIASSPEQHFQPVQALSSSNIFLNTISEPTICRLRIIFTTQLYSPQILQTSFRARYWMHLLRVYQNQRPILDPLIPHALVFIQAWCTVKFLQRFNSPTSINWYWLYYPCPSFFDPCIRYSTFPHGIFEFFKQL